MIICDLAETYQIYDYKRLPLQTVAVFVLGLRDDSRLKIELSGQHHSIDTVLLSGVFDRLSWLVWTKSEDARKGINQPTPIMPMFINVDKENKGFDSGEDFIKERERIISGLKVVEK